MYVVQLSNATPLGVASLGVQVAGETALLAAWDGGFDLIVGALLRRGAEVHDAIHAAMQRQTAATSMQ